MKPSLITPRPLSAQKKDVQAPVYLDELQVRQSNLLAREIHTQVITGAAEKNNTLVDRHIKHKVAQVLLGTMPSILIELGFMSHEHEAKLLHDKTYQETLAQGISNGIESYFACNVRSEVKP